MKKDKILVFGLCGNSIFLNVDHFHKNGETIHANAIYTELGGKGFNQAIQINKLGSKPYFIGSMGNDEIFALTEEKLKALNIDSHIFKKQIPSSFAFILTDKFGQNEVTVFSGASKLLCQEDIERIENLFVDAKFVLINYEIEENALLKIVEFAKKHDALIILNPAPYKNYDQTILNSSYIITPNLTEAYAIFECDNLDDLRKKIKAQKEIENVIVTLGEKGILIITKDTDILIPPYNNDLKVVDTTGAGDAFCGALTHFLYRNKEIKEAAILSMYLASYSTTKKHVIDSFFGSEVLKNISYLKDEEFAPRGYDNIRNTVRVFLVNENNQFGFLKIKGQDEFGIRNHLETVGGGVEENETLLDAVKREVKEETGYDIVDASYFATIIHEFNIIKRLTIAKYFYVKTSTNKQMPNLTDDEKKLFQGLKWYSFDEVENALALNEYSCTKLVHTREMLAFKMLKQYLEEKNENK